MTLRRFRERAGAIWSEVPERYREGATLLVHPEEEPDPERPGIFFLGACEPAFAALELGYAGTGDVRSGETQSLIHVWYGSFAAMAEFGTFAWDDELEETILHELTHHWEQRAGLDGLDRFDAAQLINFRRLRGFPVPAYYWRDGEPDGDDAWVIDADRFVEVEGPPPWRVDPGDGGGIVECWPDEDGWATMEGRGGTQDGFRGDLIVAPKPQERAGWWRRIWRRVRGEGR